jgi:NADH:ubiquinone oxidoreductase subunit F (NADH-binding)
MAKSTVINNARTLATIPIKINYGADIEYVLTMQEPARMD